MVTTPADNLISEAPVQQRRLWPGLVFGLVLAVLLLLAGVSA